MCSGISSLGSATRPSGNSGKSRTIATRADGTPRRAVGPYPCHGHHRDRLVPARPARPRPPVADRRGALRRPRRAGVRARRRAAARPLPRARARASFLLGCLRELREALRERGADLVVRRGRPERELEALARGDGRGRAPLRLATSRPTRWRATGASRRRRAASRWCATPACSSPTSASRAPRTASRSACSRRSGAPGSGSSGARCTARRASSRFPADVTRRRDPTLDARARATLADPFAPGEQAARERMHAWLRDGIDGYADRHDRLEGGTSELSPYLHFGCISPRELEEARRLGQGAGGVRAPAVLARLLRPRAAQQPRQRAPRPSAGDGRPRVGGRRRGLRGLVRGPHRLPGGRRRDAPAPHAAAGCTTARG